MNKKAVLTALCFLLTVFILVSCASNKNQNLSQKVSTENPAITSSEKQLRNQNIRKLSSLSQLKIPDKIIFYQGGKQKVFTRKDPEFQTIIRLNNQRTFTTYDPNHKGLGYLSLALSLDEILKSDVLVYNYDQSKYFPIYFPLIMNNNGKYYMAQPVLATDRIRFEVYGWLSSPDELTHYLKQ